MSGWPPVLPGELLIGVTPVGGGIAGKFLKVGPSGELEQADGTTTGIAIGESVSGGDPDAVLFVGSTGLLDEDVSFFSYDKTSKIFNMAGHAQFQDVNIQDTLRLSSLATSAPVLFVSGPFVSEDSMLQYDLSTHTLVRSAIADATVYELERWVPHEAGAVQWTERLGGASFFGTWDPVAYLGFNQDNLIPGAGQIAIQVEGRFHYATGPDRFGQEFHLVQTQRNGVNPLRFLSFLGDEDPAAPPGGNGRGLGMRGDLILFVDNQDDTNTMEWAAGNLQILGGGSYIVGSNNVPAVLQLNSGASAFQELLMFDSADHGRLFRQSTDWYGNSAQPGGSMRAGLVNDADNTTANAAELFLLPIGGTPGYSVAGVVRAYNAGDSTNTTGIQLKRKDATSLYAALDIGLNGSVAINPATGQSEALLDLSAGTDAIPRLKAILTPDSVNPLDVAGYIKVRIGAVDHYIQVVNASA